MAYQRGAAYAFRAGSIENLFLDFGLFGTVSMFESLSFRAVLDGIDVVNQTFQHPFGSERLLRQATCPERLSEVV